MTDYLTKMGVTFEKKWTKARLFEEIVKVPSEVVYIENEEETFRRLDGLDPTVEPVRFIVNDTESGDSDLGEDD